MVGEIKSAEVASLTSPDLGGLKQLINDAAHQKVLLQSDLNEAVADRRRAWRKLRRREQLPLRVVMKSSIPTARVAFEEAEEEALKVAAAIIATEIKVEIDLNDQTWAAWAEVTKTFDRLSQAAKFWDVTSSVAVDRFRTRSAAHEPSAGTDRSTSSGGRPRRPVSSHASNSKSALSPALALISSTSQRGRPIPGTGNTVDGRTETRHRVIAAVG